jgi:predicted SnoaL-like aldol condensation-catalyzing enzyme
MTAGQPQNSAKNLVSRAIGEVFDRREIAAIDRYFSPDYIEHSAAGTEGLDGLRKIVSDLPDGFRHERARVLSDGDLVVAHGVYHGISPEPLVAFDLWRVADGLITEHWDAHQAWAGPTPSGHSMIDGPTEVTEPRSTDASRNFVSRATGVFSSRSASPKAFAYSTRSRNLGSPTRNG